MKRLKGWQIRLRPESSEGYCWRKQKIIDLGLKTSNLLRLLLHEIAHINTESVGNQHNQKWFNEYLKFMKRYMPGVEIDESDKIIQRVFGLKNPKEQR